MYHWIRSLGADFEDDDLPRFFGLFTISFHALQISIVLFMATYAGLVYVFAVWTWSRGRRLVLEASVAERTRKQTIAQFDFRAVEWSLPLQIARWIYADTNASSKSILARIKAYAFLAFRWPAGNLAIVLHVSEVNPSSSYKALTIRSAGLRHVILASLRAALLTVGRPSAF